MMLASLLRAALPALLACTTGLELAHADVYTWTDASGAVHVSNLTPPEGVQVSKVVHENPRPAVPPPVPVISTVPQPDVQMLADRVRQLEYEVEFAKRQVPPAMQYAAVPMPPTMQYEVDAAPPASYGCDPAWSSCGTGWGFGGYPMGVVVLSAPTFRRPPPFRGNHRFAMPRPVHAPGVPHRR